MERLNVVVIGTGMYATGRGTTGHGTVLPGILEWHRQTGLLGDLHVVGTNAKHSAEAEKKIRDLMTLNGVDANLTVHPSGGVTKQEAYAEVLSNTDRPACAVIVVPDHLHYEMATSCLEAGLHVLVVKPLTASVDQAKALVNLAKKRSLYGAVEFHKRWDNANLMMRDHIISGRLGELLYCCVEYSQRKSIPAKTFRAWVEKTSVLQYLGIHYIDIARFVTGAIPRRVMATGQYSWLRSQGVKAHDAVQCMIEWEMSDNKRFMQTILTNWIDPETSSAMSDQKIKFVGTRGRFESDQKDRGIKINIDGACLEQPNPYFCVPYGNEKGKIEWGGYGIASITAYLNDVVSIVNGRSSVADVEKIRPCFKEALVSTSVLESANRSLIEDGTWQAVAL